MLSTAYGRRTNVMYNSHFEEANKFSEIPQGGCWLSRRGNKIWDWALEMRKKWDRSSPILRSLEQLPDLMVGDPQP